MLQSHILVNYQSFYFSNDTSTAQSNSLHKTMGIVAVSILLGCFPFTLIFLTVKIIVHLVKLFHHRLLFDIKNQCFRPQVMQLFQGAKSQVRRKYNETQDRIRVSQD